MPGFVTGESDNRIHDLLEDLVEKLDETIAALADQVTPVVNVPPQKAPVVNFSVPQKLPISWTFQVRNDQTGATYTITATPTC